jgi:arsenite-transporting ATPase
VSALGALLERLPRTTLVVGKGGVGKTTCATGIAAAFAHRGDRTLLVSTDPAAALSTVIGIPVGTAVTPIVGSDNLVARQLSAAGLRREFLAQWRDTIAEIIDRGTYLDREDIDGLVDAALPGSDEIFALLALADHVAESATVHTRIVVDTAPTGHTLRLLELPETFRALVAMLDLMQGKHRFMVRALTHRYRSDRADTFLDDMRGRVDAFRAALTDGDQVAAIVVTRDEPVVAAETQRFLERLRALHIRVAAIIVNAGHPESVGSRLNRSERSALPRYGIPRANKAPVGVTEANRLIERLGFVRTDTTLNVRPGGHPERSEGFARDDRMPLLRKLTIVAGKGGVGKSTVASALAIAAIDAGLGSVLLVSTDPAPSLADTFGDPTIDDTEHAVAGAQGLSVRQMDASAAFSQLRDDYQSRIDALFDSLVSRGVDVAHDRAILRELLALAPPGVDEVFALSALGETLVDGKYACVIVDPAPTGHLLRLLDMPAIALDWSHRLMRLMLKYRDVVGLGDTAQDLLDFAKRTRALDALIRDHTQCGVVIAALDEPVVRAETERLATAVLDRGIDVSAIVWNRVAQPSSPLPVAVAARHLCADEVQPPPIGVSALRTWLESWRTLPPKS